VKTTFRLQLAVTDKPYPHEPVTEKSPGFAPPTLGADSVSSVLPLFTIESEVEGDATPTGSVGVPYAPIVKDGPTGIPLPLNAILPKFVTKVAVRVPRALGVNVIGNWHW
jgi:hypothetical protein